MTDNDKLLTQAKEGDIRAFHTLYTEFQAQLKSYLYRLVANRSDMEDLAHEVFILGYENLKSFRGECTLKTWMFTIATNHARKFFKNRKIWQTDTFERTKDLAHNKKSVMEAINYSHKYAPHGSFEIREHIDYCFTCVTKMLPLEQQVALILKDIYDFKVKEIASIMDTSFGSVKHFLHNARKKMVDIFDDTCALISKRGVCDQCSGLNGKFNPKEDSQKELMKIKMVKENKNINTQKLYSLRAQLIKSIDPINGNGYDLHEVFMSINHKVNAE